MAAERVALLGVRAVEVTILINQLRALKKRKAAHIKCTAKHYELCYN